MSLRAARSLPSLRAAFQQSTKESINMNAPKVPQLQNINYGSAKKNFSTTHSVNASNKNSATKQKISTRNVHQTSQKNSTLLDSNTNKYATMNLQALKMECRTNNLKISGKKAELVQRLSAFEQTRGASSSSASTRNISTRIANLTKAEKDATKEQLKSFQKTITRKMSMSKKPTTTTTTPAKDTQAQKQQVSFSTSSKKQAKGDSSYVDSAKFPSTNEGPPEKESIAPTILAEKAAEKIDTVVTKTKIADMEGAVSVGPDKDHEEVSTFQNVVEDLKIDQAAGLEAEEPSSHDSKYKGSEETVQEKDKYILWGLLGGTIAWWSLKPKSHKQ